MVAQYTVYRRVQLSHRSLLIYLSSLARLQALLYKTPNNSRRLPVRRN